MQITYLVEITDPHTHIVKVKINVEMEAPQSALDFYLPSWSPGSYLMREYSRNIRSIRAFNGAGAFLHLEQATKNTWRLDFEALASKGDSKNFSVEYEVFCHELTVRTSHVDVSHAFLHGPSYLMGIAGQESISPKIEFRFPALWSKLHTGLKDISASRETFLYQAVNYDELIDAPVEIGCHDSDGFIHAGKEHHVAFYGRVYPHKNDLKKDIETIVKTVSSHFDGELPYDRYVFMTHFAKDKYGGLEHLNSTALQFDGRKLNNRKDYLNWLSLVAHEYFHTWNVKRIRPKELGPFDYRNEAYTRMHWLTEGLTSFMDDLFVYRAGLSSIEEYLEIVKSYLNRYFSIPGKKFHSLEDSSFNAWIKLYRPDENSDNSSISYYLKGGLVFMTLHLELRKQGKSINDLLQLLWKRYLDNPAVGLEHDEVMSMIESLAGEKVKNAFELRLCSTEDIDFETALKEAGLECVWDETPQSYLGANFRYENDRVFVQSVVLDSPAYKAGINAEDEILAVSGQRFLKDDVAKWNELFWAEQEYVFLVSRLGAMCEVKARLAQRPKLLKEIRVNDYKKAQHCFLN